MLIGNYRPFKVITHLWEIEKSSRKKTPKSSQYYTITIQYVPQIGTNKLSELHAYTFQTEPQRMHSILLGTLIISPLITMPDPRHFILDQIRETAVCSCV